MTEERKSGTRAMTWIALAVLAAAIVFAVLFLLNGNQAGSQTGNQSLRTRYITQTAILFPFDRHRTAILIGCRFRTIRILRQGIFPSFIIQ